MKILLTGKAGQVGRELQNGLSLLGELLAFDRSELDISDADQVSDCIRRIRPDIIVNAAAYTNVEAAESDKAIAFAVNAKAPGVLAEAGKAAGALVVHYSTDYVFDGLKATPYSEGDATAPLNAYGDSKRAGEQAILSSGCRHLILRVGWVYAAEGKNFLTTIVRRAGEGAPLRVVDDQYGTPTPAAWIAVATSALLANGRVLEGPGLYHLSPSGSTSWCGFAREIVNRSGLRCPVHGISSLEYPARAIRPRNSLLNSCRLRSDFGIGLPDWREGLNLVNANVSA